MSRPKLKLMVDGPLREQVAQQYKESKDPRERERLQAVKLAMSGQHTFEEISEVIGSTVHADHTHGDFVNRTFLHDLFPLPCVFILRST